MTHDSHQQPGIGQEHDKFAAPEDACTTLAADVRSLARAAPTLTPRGTSEAGLVEQSDLPSDARQALLRAAIADLKVMNVFLHEDRR
jgi:hypothetical protein